jgi:prepilin-type N-terminal cleavage/methylation domain-containing protein
MVDRASTTNGESDGARRSPRGAAAGFTLIEVIVSLAIITILAGILVPVLDGRSGKARDTRRLQDLQTLVRALDDYLMDTGSLPDHDTEVGYHGWDTTLDASFITELVDEGYLRQPLQDPLNDATHHYRYHHYPAGSEGMDADFFVVGILNFETDYFDDQTGYWQSPTRDWGEEFAYVVGGSSR